MVSLDVPPATADITEHADWLELLAIVSSSSTSSRHDLKASIRRTGSIDALEEFDDGPLDETVERESEELERIADAAFEELALREGYLAAHYPFTVDGTLRAEAGAQGSMYAFLTALTFFGPTLRTASESGSSLFERISATALVEYLGGPKMVRSYDFGFPRRNTPRNFRDAINDLCAKLGEGLKCKVSSPLMRNVKDAKLDLVAWVPFSDMRRNQLSVFGQCAAGANWQSKLNELQPVDFCNIWLQEPLAMSPLLAFFVPRKVMDDVWFQVCVGERRIFFDRLRIASLLGKTDTGLIELCQAWTAAVFDQARLMDTASVSVAEPVCHPKG